MGGCAVGAGMRILVLVPTYNRPDLLDRCLASIAAQDDPAFDVIVADDASTDDEVEVVLNIWWLTQMIPGRWDIQRNAENVGSVRNILTAIASVDMEPDDVIVLVDGDDRLAHPGALTELRRRFDGTSNLLMYGSYDSDPPCDTCPPAEPIPEWVLRSGVIRAMALHHRMPWNHPIAFRRCLFDEMDESDFTMPDGTWMRYGYDVALMAPMIELAGTRVEFCPDVLYTYTSDRPEAVHRIHAEATAAENRWVLNQLRKYAPMEWEPS